MGVQKMEAVSGQANGKEHHLPIAVVLAAIGVLVLVVLCKIFNMDNELIGVVVSGFPKISCGALSVGDLCVFGVLFGLFLTP